MVAKGAQSTVSRKQREKGKVKPETRIKLCRSCPTDKLPPTRLPPNSTFSYGRIIGLIYSYITFNVQSPSRSPICENLRLMRIISHQKYNLKTYFVPINTDIQGNVEVAGCEEKSLMIEIGQCQESDRHSRLLMMKIRFGSKHFPSCKSQTSPW